MQVADEVRKSVFFIYYLTNEGHKIAAIPAGDSQHDSSNSELGLTVSSRGTDGVGAVWNGTEESNFEPESTNPTSLTDSDSATFAPAGIAGDLSTFLLKDCCLETIDEGKGIDCVSIIARGKDKKSCPAYVSFYNHNY